MSDIFQKLNNKIDILLKNRGEEIELELNDLRNWTRIDQVRYELMFINKIDTLAVVLCEDLEYLENLLKQSNDHS